MNQATVYFIVIAVAFTSFLCGSLYTRWTASDAVRTMLDFEEPYAKASTQSSDALSDAPEPSSSGKNIVFVYTGRWSFLRIQFPYLFRELRINGGVVDEVIYFKIKMDEDSETKLTMLIKTANRLLKRKVFRLHQFPGKCEGIQVRSCMYRLPYFVVVHDLVANPLNKYFKLDDDVVYIHPGTFKTILEAENTKDCLLHFGNIIGSNWRSSYIHQSMGLFNNTTINPDKLKFDFSPSAECGWKSLACNKLTLDTFLHHHKLGQLHKYYFQEPVKILPDYERFSINFYLLDMHVFDVEALFKAQPLIDISDEIWWTIRYTQTAEKHHCIVGEALVVHFSYGTTAEQLLELGYRKKFEAIATKEVGNQLPLSLWSELGYINHTES